MSLPERETTLRAPLGLLYVSEDRAIRRVDRFALLGLLDIDSFVGAIRSELSVLPSIIAKGSIDTAIEAELSLQPRSP